MMTNPLSSIDLKNLSEAELEIVVQVIQKDFELKAAEKARLRRHKRQLKDYDKRVSILASSNFNENFCVICFQRFFIIVVRKRCCYSCRHLMCTKCSEWVPALKSYICLLCQKERNLKSMACEWYYNLLKSRFQQDGSEVVAQSLYSNQGQYTFIHLFYRKLCYNYKPEWAKNLRHSETEDSITTPDLLKKVKGAQISRYRQKINARWEEMQDRLRMLEQSNISKAKKDEAWHYLTEEFKNNFREILKEFSQFLYITLENYAAKVDDPDLNINEQVITTVYDEVELMIGYRINYMPEDMGSVISDVESTASMFIGNQMEERLAAALVNKIVQDHSLNELQNFDMKSLTQDDQSSGISQVYRARPYHTMQNGTVSGRSSAAASSMIDSEQLIEMSKYNSLQYANPSRSHRLRDSVSTTDDVNDTDDIILNVDQIQNMLRYSNTDRQNVKQIIERMVHVPYGEPIKLQFQLDNVSNIEVTWTKTFMGRTLSLNNSDAIEISEHMNNNNVIYTLKIWQSTDSDSGLYTVMILNQPLIEFTVNLVVSSSNRSDDHFSSSNLPDDDNNPNTFKKPTFRLKMLNCNCRTGQIGEFSVEAIGYPEPRVTFYHNNKLILFPSEKYRLEYKDHISRYCLRIMNVTETDHGTYKCMASNSGGTCECTAQLQVTNIKFRFDKKIPRSTSASNSSVEDEIFTYPQTPKHITKKDLSNNGFEAPDGTLNELVEIHQHLMYLECQLDWFEEQTSQDSLKSPKPLKSSGSFKVQQSPNTFIGREVPDEFKIKDQQKTSRLPRAVHSYSSENLDTSDSNFLARNQSSRNPANSLNNSNTNISKLKQLFEHGDSGYFPRNSSITGRTQGRGQRRAQSPFTREVRVSRYDQSN